MKKILILGATGMAGHIISLYLNQFQNKYIIIPICHRFKLNNNSILCDVSDLTNLNNLISKENPNVIINCIGILNKSAEFDIKNTIYINTFLPRFLCRIGEINNIKIIHLSTDCVFSGVTGNYREDSFKDENSTYGLSKNLGEISNENCLTIRTSIIGPELKDGTGLFHWFMNQTGIINGYSKVYWTGITTLELAKSIDKALDSNINGIYHIVANKKISKYDLLNIIKSEFNKNDIIIREDTNYICDKSLISTKTDFNYIQPSYETMINNMKTWMLNHINLYNSYFI